MNSEQLTQTRDTAAAIRGEASKPGALLRIGVVDSVQTSTVTIKLGGDTTTIAGVKYLACYSPVAGDTVCILENGHDLLILDRISDNTYRIGKSGSTIGKYGVTPAARPSAYTQTYSTASRTQTTPVGVDPGAATITDPADAPASADALRDDLVTNALSGIRTAISNLRTQVQNLITDVANVKQVTNSIIDDHQAGGDFQ